MIRYARFVILLGAILVLGAAKTNDSDSSGISSIVLSRTSCYGVCLALATNVDRVDVAVLANNCRGFNGDLTYTLHWPPETTRSIRASKNTEGIWQLTFYVPPGHYRLVLDGKSPNKRTDSNSFPVCESDDWFTTLAGHDRHVVEVLGRISRPHSNCSVAGTLPAPGLNVHLILPKGHKMVDSTVGGLMDPTTEDIDYDAVIDGSAYYAEHVPVQDYVLRIGDLDIPVDLTKRIDPKDPYCQGEFIHNVTVDEMRRAFGSSFVTE